MSKSLFLSHKEVFEAKPLLNQGTIFVTNIDEPESKSLKVGTQQARCNFSRCYSQRRTVDIAGKLAGRSVAREGFDRQRVRNAGLHTIVGPPSFYRGAGQPGKRSTQERWRPWALGSCTWWPPRSRAATWTR